jgi:hypothetical protein
MTVPRHRTLEFLLSRSAHTVPHLHGTLLDHLVATEELLRSWGCPEELCRAGLCHATYGTDGFAPFLVAPDDRAVLAAAAGPEVEQIVYLYASCDRSFVYPQLPGEGPVRFRDRFLLTTCVPSPASLRDFVDLTLANEIDVAGSGDLASGPPPWIGPLVDALGGRASPGVATGARRLLAGWAPGPGPGRSADPGRSAARRPVRR